jgi:hypothetical protein
MLFFYLVSRNDTIETQPLRNCGLSPLLMVFTLVSWSVLLTWEVMGVCEHDAQFS